MSDATKKSGSRLVGDVDYEAICQVAGHITPVPGGVGPMTVAMLMKNVVISAQRSAKALLQATWTISHLPLTPSSPIPRYEKKGLYFISLFIVFSSINKLCLS